MKKIIDYIHHNKKVFVQEHLKGKHREHCLCFNCESFKPENREKNCSIANDVFKNCVQYNIVTPVWECPIFKNSKIAK